MIRLKTKTLGLHHIRTIFNLRHPSLFHPQNPKPLDETHSIHTRSFLPTSFFRRSISSSSAQFQHELATQEANMDPQKPDIEEELMKKLSKMERKKKEDSTEKINKKEDSTDKRNKKEDSTKKKNKEELTDKRNKKEDSTEKRNKKEDSTKKKNKEEDSTEKRNKKEDSTKEEHLTEKRNKKEVSTKKKNKKEDKRNKKEDSTEKKKKKEEDSTDKRKKKDSTKKTTKKDSPKETKTLEPLETVSAKAVGISKQGENKEPEKQVKKLSSLFLSADQTKKLRKESNKKVEELKGLSPDMAEFATYLHSKGYLAKANFLPNNTFVASRFMNDYGRNFLNFAAEEFAKNHREVYKWLPAGDLKKVAQFGCPSLSRKFVFSAKAMRLNFEIQEKTVCSKCAIKESCKFANQSVWKKGERNLDSVDVMRVITSYALHTQSEVPDDVRDAVNGLLKEVVRLSELES